MNVPIQVDEIVSDFLKKMPIKVFYKELEIKKNIGFQRHYLFSSNHGHYSLSINKKNIRLTSHCHWSVRHSWPRLVYEGNLDSQSLQQMITALADNFIDTWI